MKNIKKFNDLYESNSSENRKDGFYWIKWEHDPKWTIGKYDSVYKGLWLIFGKFGFTDDDLEEIGPYIGTSPKTEEINDTYTTDKYGYNQMKVNDLEGINIKKLKYSDEGGHLQIYSQDGKIIEIGCAGGARTEVTYRGKIITDEILNKFNNLMIIDARSTREHGIIVDILITFNNDYVIKISDETGGEGLEISKIRKY